MTYANTRRLSPHLTQANTSKSNILLSNSAQSTRGALCFIRSFLAAASIPAEVKAPREAPGRSSRVVAPDTIANLRENR